MEAISDFSNLFSSCKFDSLSLGILVFSLAIGPFGAGSVINGSVSTFSISSTFFSSTLTGAMVSEFNVIGSSVLSSAKRKH